MYTLVMAEGGYDPTTENETPWEDHGIDHDGDDDDDDTTGPGTPGASSTPYQPGPQYHPEEEHEMTHMGPEQEGLGDTDPLIPPEYNDFVFTEDKKTLINKVKDFIKAVRPKVDFSKMVIDYGRKKANQGKPVALGPKGGETVIFKQDNTFTAAFSKQYSGALGPSAENIIAEDQMTLRDTQQRVTA